MRHAVKLAGIVGLMSALALLVPVVIIQAGSRNRVYSDPGAIPSAPVALVFGAAVRPDGTPTAMLADRVEAAVNLYKAGKVQRLLMTGDNSTQAYNEVASMKRLAVQLGVPDDKVNLDYAGFRTYDSVYRARKIFGITDAILVSQGYHLPRALYLAGSFGIKATGFKAGLDHYPRQEYYNAREVLAEVVAWYQAILLHPSPRFLGDPIDLDHQNDH